ncbi:hypothetical protein ElyMa_007030300 [Elysia marginata]|uniref:Uncharacterized protein n=1 Tax=Elysia marginata TaxID=1093978 RepID=A0AAV4JU27_9GAST|nr:hypothetical protein ElyMa_007030300 [Elysia marginata]
MYPLLKEKAPSCVLPEDPTEVEPPIDCRDGFEKCAKAFRDAIEDETDKQKLCKYSDAIAGCVKNCAPDHLKVPELYQEIDAWKEEMGLNCHKPSPSNSTENITATEVSTTENITAPEVSTPATTKTEPTTVIPRTTVNRKTASGKSCIKQTHKCMADYSDGSQRITRLDQMCSLTQTVFLCINSTSCPTRTKQELTQSIKSSIGDSMPYCKLPTLGNEEATGGTTSATFSTKPGVNPISKCNKELDACTSGVMEKLLENASGICKLAKDIIECVENTTCTKPFKKQMINTFTSTIEDWLTDCDLPYVENKATTEASTSALVDNKVASNAPGTTAITDNTGDEASVGGCMSGIQVCTDKLMTAVPIAATDPERMCNLLNEMVSCIFDLGCPIPKEAMDEIYKNTVDNLSELAPDCKIDLPGNKTKKESKYSETSIAACVVARAACNEEHSKSDPKDIEQYCSDTEKYIDCYLSCETQDGEEEVFLQRIRDLINESKLPCDIPRLRQGVSTTMAPVKGQTTIGVTGTTVDPCAFEKYKCSEVFSTAMSTSDKTPESICG